MQSVTHVPVHSPAASLPQTSAYQKTPSHPLFWRVVPVRINIEVTRLKLSPMSGVGHWGLFARTVGAMDGAAGAARDGFTAILAKSPQWPAPA